MTPGDPRAWSGVLFVRKGLSGLFGRSITRLTPLSGPYAPAILRFDVAFPPSYPALPPTITFTTDIFQPLVTPLTTYTYTTGSSNLDTVSATDEERLPPGGFSLRHGFPHWFGRKEKKAARSADSSSDVGASHDGSQQLGGIVEHLLDDEDPEVSSQRRKPPNSKRRIPFSHSVAEQPSIIEILLYIKATFDDEKILDVLPLEAAGNPGAWKAWQAHRRKTRQSESPTSLDQLQGSRPKQPGDWSWDGVWLERVTRNIDASTSESVLYANPTVKKDKSRQESDGDDPVRIVLLFTTPC